MKPLIGLTACGRNNDGEFRLKGDYSDAVARAGGAPVLIPPVDLEPEAWLDRCDGLIFAGGGDVDPDVYGGPAHETIRGIDAPRDRLELALVREILRRKTPTLAICRGIQMVNVALGGTLIADLPSAIGRAICHRTDSRQAIPHSVRVEPDALLARALGTTACEPMSSHHQAIDRLAPDLRVVARAPDDVIEAVETPSHPRFLAVQWHPEMSAADDPVQQRLFDWLVAACKSG